MDDFKTFFDDYRENLARNDWFAFIDYVEKHENCQYLVLFPKLKGCITKKMEFIINYN